MKKLDTLPLSKDEKKLLKTNYLNLVPKMVLEKKSKEIKEIINLMCVYVDDETAIVKANEFIECIAHPGGNMPTKEDVEIKLDFLGLQKEDKKKWLNYFKPNTKKEVSNSDENQSEKIREQIQHSTKQMLHTLERLHTITSYHRNYENQNCTIEFCKNDFLYYACEYLSGTLRNQAIILEDKIRFLKNYNNFIYNINGYNMIFSRLETQLSNLIKKGNDIFHLHDATTSGTQTEDGRRYYLLGEIIHLLDETLCGEGFLSSLKYNLKLCLTQCENLIAEA